MTAGLLTEIENGYLLSMNHEWKHCVLLRSSNRKMFCK